MSSHSFASTDMLAQGLIYNILQRPALPADAKGLTIAIVAPHPGAGTTHVTNLLAEALNKDKDDSAVALDCRELARMKASCSLVPGFASGKTSSSGAEVQSSWRGSREFRAAYLSQLRDRFSYILFDCPSLRETNDVLSLASLVDGVVLVVEANRTSRRRISYLEQAIERSGGTSLGFILNKRTYPIPDWLFRRLESWGIW